MMAHFTAAKPSKELRQVMSRGDTIHEGEDNKFEGNLDE
jgi:hypothetical protein